MVNALDNPRGLNFGPLGRLYIAEAGRGGDGECGPGPEGTRCYGATGAITRWNPKTGNSHALRVGCRHWRLRAMRQWVLVSFATGPHDIDLDPLGFAFVTIGFGGDPTHTSNGSLALMADGSPVRLMLLPHNNALTVKDLGNFGDGEQSNR